MGYVLSAVGRVLEQPTAWGAAWEMALLAGPLWAAALLGLLLGWAWRPRWAAGLVVSAADGGAQPPFATLDFWKAQLPARLRAPLGTAVQQREDDKDAVQGSPETASEELAVAVAVAVGKDDLANLWRLVEGADGGPAWTKMMEKSLPTMTYRAWRRDAQTGPPQYQSSSIFENATPEEVRDFFGDDEFRMSNGWDDMLVYHKTLEECPTTGTMKVHWVRKFPFFCSDREYIIARRIWKLGGAYYCVTKGIPCSSIPRRSRPRRVDLYYSSWCIRAVESRRGGGRTACEVLLFHHEDMGIPYEIAKLGIRQGMWGCVRRIEPGLRAYQEARAAGAPASRGALMARINTKVSADGFARSMESSEEPETVDAQEKPARSHAAARLLVLGGAVALACCTLDQGLLTKALIFGVARRFVGQRKTL